MHRTSSTQIIEFFGDFQPTPSLNIRRVYITAQDPKVLWCKPRQHVRSEGENLAQLIIPRVQRSNTDYRFSHLHGTLYRYGRSDHL